MLTAVPLCKHILWAFIFPFSSINPQGSLLAAECRFQQWNNPLRWCIIIYMICEYDGLSGQVDIWGLVDMGIFDDRLKSFFAEFGKGRKMVLSTSENNRVSSRMMSVVQIDGDFYFQTDATMRKHHQISVNNYVALCIDNIQIEGKCTEIGHPLSNPRFCEVFQECFKGSYDAYSALENERLFVMTPLYIERWIYKDRIPYIETFDLVNEQYCFSEYSGR